MRSDRRRHDNYSNSGIGRSNDRKSGDIGIYRRRYKMIGDNSEGCILHRAGACVILSASGQLKCESKCPFHKTYDEQIAIEKKCGRRCRRLHIPYSSMLGGENDE